MKIPKLMEKIKQMNSNILDSYTLSFANYFYSNQCIQDLDAVVTKIKKYNQILILGNGGSCTIATHICEDFAKMVGIPALAFNDAAMITCLSNDYSYEDAMSEWIKIYGYLPREMYDPNSLAIFISSSGKSQNVINAAKTFGKTDTITLTGFKKGNSLSQLGDINVWIDSQSYGEVESFHATFLHIVLDTLIQEKNG